MAIKLKRPDPGEERLSWAQGVACEICTEEGRLKGKLDFRFMILPPSDLDEEIHAEDQIKTYEFVKRILRGVRGLNDEEGKPWDDDEAIEFVLLAPELIMTAFRAYFAHIASGEHRKKASGT